MVHGSLSEIQSSTMKWNILQVCNSVARLFSCSLMALPYLVYFNLEPFLTLSFNFEPSSLSIVYFFFFFSTTFNANLLCCDILSWTVYIKQEIAMKS